MITCGLKLTHDSAIALFDDNKLIVSIELEKIENNNRYKIIDSLDSISSILVDNGLDHLAIDKFVIDGWVGLNESRVVTNSKNRPVELRVACYHESKLEEDVLKHSSFLSPLADDTFTSYE